MQTALNLFKNNPLCELFKIELPIIQGGMVWASGARLAAAVSSNGGLGLLGAGSMTPFVLATHIDKIRTLTCKPFGVNIPIALGFSQEHVRICLEKKIDIVFTAAGNPKLYTQKLKDSGIKVVHVVPSARLAKKAQEAGCDAVVAEGCEAGGHNGRDCQTSLILWPQVARQVSVPVIAAGGIGSGQAIAAAFALGASGVQIGTRFAVTLESGAHTLYKEACVRASTDQARLYNELDMPIRSLENNFVKEYIKRQYSGQTQEELKEFKGVGRSKKGVFEGDLEEGELVAGQVCGEIKDIPSVKELIKRLVFQFEEVVLCKKQI